MATATERKAAQRARAKALGLCVVCCRRKRRIVKGRIFATCRKCDRDAKERLDRIRGKA